MDEVHKKELLSAIRSQIEWVGKLCLAEEVLYETKVHEVRKAFKRLNALLKLFPEVLQTEVDHFRKPMRIVARRLTMGRESTVNEQLFERLIFETGGLDEKINNALKERLKQTKEDSLRELIEEEKVLDDVFDLIKSGEKNLLPVLELKDYEVHVFNKIEATFLRSKDLHRVIAARYDAELYHDLRKQMKTLWYQSEIEAPGQTEIPGTILEKLHNITDQQGDDHDWFIFINEISQAKYGLNPTEIQALTQLVHKLQKINLSLLNQNLDDFFKISEQQYLNLLRQL